jgi:hypothetical protein
VAVSHTQRSSKADRSARAETLCNWLKFLAALGGLIVGILLLWGIWDGGPVVAAFTRVGGATRVETALEASRFWLRPPQLVVETQTHASQLMLGAARCAVAHDAPLLFTSPDPQRQQLVGATVNDWRQIETPIGRARPEVITIEPQRDTWQAPTLPEVITIQNPSEVTSCLASGDPADVAGLSIFEVPNPPIRLPQVPARHQQTLAKVVVFAAAIEPGDPPDVAVGLALAAHMARANREEVSLVVVPHYLESDGELENKLERHHELVTGGVVLGETPTVPEDTRVLLRQLLTSRDRHGVLGQLQTNLGSVDPLVAALLAIAGFGAATQVTPEITPQAANLAHRAAEGIPKLIRGTPKLIVGVRKLMAGVPKLIAGVIPKLIAGVRKLIAGVPKVVKRPGEGDFVTKKGAQIANLRADQNVTVWLGSRWKVTGKVVGTYDGTIAVLELKEAKLEQEGNEPSLEADFMLVPVQDIQLIGINVHETSAASTLSSPASSPSSK